MSDNDRALLSEGHCFLRGPLSCPDPPLSFCSRQLYDADGSQKIYVLPKI